MGHGAAPAGILASTLLSLSCETWRLNVRSAKWRGVSEVLLMPDRFKVKL